jgi:hypothetical protein
MTDTFANRPSAPSDVPLEHAQQAGEVTGTLAELERKLRELERELTAIGRRRELTGAPATGGPTGGPGVPTAGGPTDAEARSSTPPGGRLVDEAIEPPSKAAPAAPTGPSGGSEVKLQAETAWSGASVHAHPESEPQAGGASQGAPRELHRPSTPQSQSEPQAGGASQGAPQEPHRPSTPQSQSEPQAGGASQGAPQEPHRPSTPQSQSEPGERPRPSEAQLASLAELRRFRHRLERFARDLASEYDALLGRVMSGLTSAASASTSPEATYASAQSGASPPFAPPAAAPAPPPPPAPPSPEETTFQGRVELGVGPFYDIASLSAFERQLADLPHVTDASVRRFEASHAVVDVRLSAPMALVRELRRTMDSNFSVREVADGRILLTFDEV